MAYRELTMIDVREVLRRWAAGQSERMIARQTGVDRKTVGRYVMVARELDLPKDRPLDDAEVHEVARRVQARTVADPSAERAEVAKHRERIMAWLKQQRPLRLRKIHTLLVRDHSVKASYATLRRYAQTELGWQKKPSTVRLDDTPPGQVAQIDFGRMGRIVDASTGRLRMLWVLIVTLVHSRYQFVWPTFEQTTEATCEGLDAAWRFFDAMPEVIVPDNMPAIVRKADPLKPKFTDSFLDYAQTRGLLVDAARVRSPKDKARVENQVAYVRESWFDGETFLELQDARASAEYWCREIAGTRVHGTTRQVPREAFALVERSAMKPAPAEPFDVPIFVTATVQPDHHIQVATSLYSVPPHRDLKKVRVRADKKVVRIYAGTELIRVHQRVAPGQRSTDPHDYPEHKAAYALRSDDAILSKARACGEHVGIYAERLLEGPLPWTRMRHAYALLRLCKRFGEGRVEALCQSALAFDVVDVTRIARMLQSATKPATPQTDDPKVVHLVTPRFARSDEHFVTRATTRKERK